MYETQLPDIFENQDVSREEWERWRADVIARFDDLLGEGETPYPPPNVQVQEEHDEDGFTRRLVSYAIAEDDTGWAWLCVPEDLDEPAPVVLCLHGTTADAKDACLGIGEHPGGSDGIAVHLAKRGVVTFSPDHFCAGQRAPENHPPYNVAEFYDRYPDWSEMGKDIYDHRQAINALTELDFVDGSRIGCIGHSLGGYGTVFLAAMDERVTAAVSSCGVTSWRVDPNRDNWSRTPPGRYKHFPKLRQYFAADEPPPVDMPEIMAAIAPRAFLNLSAVGNDVCFPIFEPFAEIYMQVERVYKALDTEGQFSCYFHSEGHSFPDQARALAYTWLQDKLEMQEEIKLA
ncbi:MAG: alpha/beta fold hydrolase [Armatimonadota bacterium]